MVNFNNPNTASPCTEINAGGLADSDALVVTGGDGNATCRASSWDYSSSNASISVSLMVDIRQATETGNKIQVGILNSNNAEFAIASGVFGSF